MISVADAFDAMTSHRLYRDNLTFENAVDQLVQGKNSQFDPVAVDVARYIDALAGHGLTLIYTLETHVHADHVTAADALRQRLGSKSVVHRDAGARLDFPRAGRARARPQGICQRVYRSRRR